MTNNIHDKQTKECELLTGILFKCVRNSSIHFTEEELNVIIPFIKTNSFFSSIFISDACIRNKLKMYQKIELLNNIDIDILFSTNYFDFCSKTELLKLLSDIEDKKIINKIINESDIKDISLKGLKDRNKIDYIKSLLVAKKMAI